MRAYRNMEGTVDMSQDSVRTFHPWFILAAPGSPAEDAVRALSGEPHRAVTSPNVLAPGIPPSPAHDLIYNGGKTIASLIFTNVYVGGAQAWNGTDMQKIDTALVAAMTDVRLNNVMAQYFRGQTVASSFLPSRVLPGTRPAFMSQGDVESLLAGLHSRNLLGAGPTVI